MTYLEELTQLKQEHLEIQARINELKSLVWSWPRQTSTLLLELIDFVHHHHAREETSLFPFVAKQDWLNQGGPRCGFFMSQIMDLKIHEGFTQVLKNYGCLAQRQDRNWVSASSPLWVPLDEHDIGTAFGAAIKDELNKLEAEQNINKLKDLASTYLRLVEVHRQKEDECLFVLLANELSKIET